jgi:sialidase-1
VGFAEVDITPPLGHRLGGYFRDRFAEAIRDPLRAKAMVLSQGGTRAALVLCDLVGVPAWISGRVREQAQSRTGIPAANIAVAGTHTHTGPFLPRDAEPGGYSSVLVDRLVEAVARAHASLGPARLEAGAVAQSPAVSFNRRHLFKDGKVRTIGPVTRHLPDHEPGNIVATAGPIDPDVGVLLVRDPGSGRPGAALSVFALHLNTVGDTTKGESVCSADFPAVLERELRKEFGPGFRSLFGAGTCGDINYVDPKTPGTRSAEEIGTLLARTVASGVPKLRPLERPSLAVRSARFDAPLQRFPPERVEQARRDVARAKEVPFYTLVEAHSILDLDRKGGTYPLEVQAFRLGREAAIVAVPGEVFVELGLAIKRGSPFRTTFVIELANDSGPAYIPTKKAFTESGYEVLASRLEAGGGERIVEEAVRLLKELAEEMGSAGPIPGPVRTDVFVSGQEGYPTYRIPSVVVSPKGTILAFCEGRKSGGSDSGDIDLVLKRSFDGGATWGPLQVVWDDGPNTCGNPAAVVDRDTGTIWLALTHNLGKDTEAQIQAGTSQGTRTVWITRSDDDGAAWAKPVEITKDVKKPGWTWFGTGEGVGIQTRGGRLVIPGEAREGGTRRSLALVFTSEDHGKSWKLGGTVGDTFGESQVVELADGTLMLNMRNHDVRAVKEGGGARTERGVALSRDGGRTWSPAFHDPALVEPHCQGSILRYTWASERGKSRILFSNPASRQKRVAMTVRLSSDEGKSWSGGRVLHEGPSGYSCLAALPDGSIGCLYERGERRTSEKVTFDRFTLGWLTDGADSLAR